MKKTLTEIKTPFLITLVFIVICGLFYPLLMTGLGQTLFPHQANGSQVIADGKVIGSSLIGQEFTTPQYMKGRPSAVNYNTYTTKEKEEGIYTGVSSGSQNLAPSNPALQHRVEKAQAAFLKAKPTITKSQIPTDLLTASGSGLDPDISPESALVQVPELSKTTGLSESKLKEIVRKNTQNKLLGFLGEKTVNVLSVNIDIAKFLSQNK